MLPRLINANHKIVAKEALLDCTGAAATTAAITINRTLRLWLLDSLLHVTSA